MSSSAVPYTETHEVSGRDCTYMKVEGEARRLCDELADRFWNDGWEAIADFETEYPGDVIEAVSICRNEHGELIVSEDELRRLTDLVPSLSGDREKDIQSGVYTESWNSQRAWLAETWIRKEQYQQGFLLLADAVRYDHPFTRGYDGQSEACGQDSITDALSHEALKELFARALSSYDAPQVPNQPSQITAQSKARHRKRGDGGP